MELVTIGVFGFSERAFFEALTQAHVDTFCDIRWRRGVRGAEYAFVNSARLQRKLSEMGIRYLHFRELAPSPALRQRQNEADKTAGIAKRKRTALGEEFIQGYIAERLTGFDTRRFVQQLGPDVRVAALFCVEREPSACHRSLLAARLENELGIRATHLLPQPHGP
jgi:uncharacterized protein (DUF488 family)